MGPLLRANSAKGEDLFDPMAKAGTAERTVEGEGRGNKDELFVREGARCGIRCAANSGWSGKDSWLLHTMNM